MKKNSNDKTNAKRMGIKSFIKNGDERFITTSIKNEFPVELKLDVIKKTCEPAHEPVSFDYDPKKIDFEKPVLKEKLTSGQSGQKLSTRLFIQKDRDICGIRRKYLEKIFNSNFIEEKKDSNLPMQIVAKVLSTEKVFSNALNKIISQFLSMPRGGVTDNHGEYEIIGNIINHKSLQELNKEKKTKRIKKYLQSVIKNQSYLYNKQFLLSLDESKGSRNDIDENELYDYIRFLAILRNGIAHVFYEKNEPETAKESLFRLVDFIKNDKKLEGAFAKIKIQVNTLYKCRKEEYIKKSGKNFEIIRKIYQNDKPDEKVKDWIRYDFDKSYKYIGLSVAKLGNYTSWAKDIDNLRDKSNPDSGYAGIMHRLNEFSVYLKVKALSTEEKDKYLKNLISKENCEEKDKYYKNIAQFFCSSDLKFANVLQMVKEIKKNKGCTSEDKNCKLCVDERKFNDLSVIVYFISCFLDNKDQNIFLSDLINRFGALSDLLRIQNKILGAGNKYNENYSFLKNERYVTEIKMELETIFALVKVSYKKEDKAFNRLLEDGLVMFGFSKDEAGMKVAGLKEIKEKKEGHYKNKSRSFLINSIVNSRKFAYLAKSIDPQKVPAIIKNEHIVRYILGRINKTNPGQIGRYWRYIMSQNHAGTDKVDDLTNEIIKINIKNILNDAGGWQKSKLNDNNNKKKLKYQQLIGLYLTVAYIFVKNMLECNARYFSAFAQIEKDYLIYTNSDEFYYIDKNKKNLVTERYLKLVKDIIEKNKNTVRKDKIFRKKRQRKHLADISKSIIEFEKLPCCIFTLLRNITEHLNVASNIDIIEGYGKRAGKYHKNAPASYFIFYHYIIQKILADKICTRNLLNIINTYGEPSISFIKIIYVPFAYNLPRYLNLTDARIFCNMDDK